MTSRRILNVLIACEESQAECEAFRACGHRAFSCDIQECRKGGHPEWHIHGDVTPYLVGKTRFRTQDGRKHFLKKQLKMKTQYYRMPDGSIHIVHVRKSNQVLPSLLLEVDGEADLQTIPPRCEFCVVKDTCWRYSVDEHYDYRGSICDAYQPFW